MTIRRIDIIRGDLGVLASMSQLGRCGSSLIIVASGTTVCRRGGRRTLFVNYLSYQNGKGRASLARRSRKYKDTALVAPVWTIRYSTVQDS
jgi:hypothetical protein